ncbi:MAG: hypothetical protein IJF33_01890 [Clostridia bacterium]|nr:hypothetical protein [Clostridia bacterium]
MMTEIEKIEYTKEFIDKLAKGINPLDDTPIPEGDLVNHVRLSRCFSYVSGILGKIIEKEKRKEANHKIPKRERFYITAEQLQNFQYSEEPLSIGEFCRRMEALIDLSKVKHISRARLPLWLAHVGLLCPPAENARHYAGAPTEEGMRLGITQITYTNDYGTHTTNALGLDAQRFVVDNVESLLGFREKSKKT